MNHINRLLMQAKRARNGKGRHIMGFVEYIPAKDRFTVSCTIWDGVAGSGGESVYSEHNNQEDAIAACEAVAAQYPNSENIIFIIDDVAFLED